MNDETGFGRITSSRFRPAPWLRNRHLQTVFPSVVNSGPRPCLIREYLDLPDGDVTVVDRLAANDDRDPASPLLVLLHGLESSSSSNYARQLLAAAEDRGWRALVLHFRDCGDYRNRLPRRYHAGETNDLRYFINKLVTAGETGPLLTVGYSLGGNVLLKYLGEDGAACPVHAAAAVCVPLSLQRCADALKEGFSRVYQRHLLNRMKLAVRRKFNEHTAAFDWHRAMSATTFADFDDAVTAPLHGFRGKDDYYESCSSIRFLADIDRPTLILNSRDDPFMKPDMFPTARQLSPAVTLELSDGGGHVGFIEGGSPWQPRYFLPGRIVDFLAGELDGAAETHRALPAL